MFSREKYRQIKKDKKRNSLLLNVKRQRKVFRLLKKKYLKKKIFSSYNITKIR